MRLNDDTVTAVREYPHVYSVRYTGEYGTKQRPTRWEMIRRLERNIGAALRRRRPDTAVKVSARWDHLTVKAMAPVEEVLCDVPGVQFVAPVRILPLAEPKEAYPPIAEYFRPAVEGKTFGVRVRVALKKQRSRYPHWKRRSAEVALGDALYAASAGVDLTHPDVFCYVEVRDEGIFLFTEKLPGLGGLPVGFTGRSLMLFSGGIDSPVAAWMAYHSGIELDFVYYDLGGAEQRRRAETLHQTLTHRYAGEDVPPLHVVDFGPIIAELRRQPARYQNLLLKVFFYKVGAAMLDRLDDAVGLVTGEAMGQVSTQTIHNLALLDRFVDVPVWRPLLMMPKSDIIERARRIGTFDAAYTGKEFCALATRHVATRTHVNKVEELLRQMPVDDLIGQVLSEAPAREERPEAPSNEGKTDWVVIDVRSQPVPAVAVPDHVELRHVPFERAWNEFLTWDPAKRYIVFCEAGQQSALLVRFMTEQGFQAVDVPGGAAEAETFIQQQIASLNE